jgi:hypothetical protein
MIPNREAYLAALEELRKTYLTKPDTWIAMCEKRFDFIRERAPSDFRKKYPKTNLTDEEIKAILLREPVYYVELSDKIGDSIGRIKAYMVKFDSRTGYWCQEEVLNPFLKQQREEIHKREMMGQATALPANVPCTHIGAVHLLRLYQKYLHLAELSSRGQWSGGQYGP